MIDFLEANQVQDLMKFINSFGSGYVKNSDDDKILVFLLSRFDSVISVKDVDILHPLGILNYMKVIGSKRLFFLHDSFFDTNNPKRGLFIEQETTQIEVENFLENEFVAKSNDSDSCYPIYVYIGKGLFVDIELSLFIHVSTFHEAAYFFSPNEKTIKNILLRLKNEGIKYELR